MWFFTLLSWVASCCQILLMTLCVAAGLYYLAELVEENTVATKKVTNSLIYATLGIYCGLGLFESLPWSMLIAGVLSQLLHLLLMQTFPYFVVSSPPFIATVAMVVVNHYLAFSYFAEVWHPFSEVLAFFTVCLWLVPFTLFISLSANDFVLPSTMETQPVLDDNDVVSSYFNRKNKKFSLLSGLQYVQENWLGIRGKKRF